MTFCKIDGCLNHGSYGGYCTSHQSQRAERAEAERAELQREIEQWRAQESPLQKIIDELTGERDTVIEQCEQVTDQRDTAWQELRDIRTAINADKDESTFDEVNRQFAKLTNQYDVVRAEVAEIITLLDPNEVSGIPIAQLVKAMWDELKTARAEVERLRVALKESRDGMEMFIGADCPYCGGEGSWTEDGKHMISVQHREQCPYSIARAALDAPAEKEQTK